MSPALAEVAHSRGVPLVVDEAWGAHLHFHPDLPTDALACGADLVTSSTHKIVGSLTQSAMLHLGRGGRIDGAVVDRCVSLVETTSPSGLLAGSLDAARRHMYVHGEEMLSEAMAGLAKTREKIREIPGLDVLDERMVGRPGVAGWDPLRLGIDVRGTGSSAQRLWKTAFHVSEIDLELYSGNVVVADLRRRRAGGGERRAAGRGAAQGGRRAGGDAGGAGREAGAGAALGRAGADAARSVPWAAGGCSLRRCGGAGCRRGAGGLSAGDSECASWRAAYSGDS